MVTVEPLRGTLPKRLLGFARNDKRGSFILFPTNTCPLQRRMVICFFPTPAAKRLDGSE